MQLQTQNLQPIEFTQGDSPTLLLAIVDDDGVPVNLTGASFETQILGPNGVGPVVFPNGQHTITNAALGQFSLALATTDTPNVNIGSNIEIITMYLIGADVETARGPNLLTVYPPVPTQ